MTITKWESWEKNFNFTIAAKFEGQPNESVLLQDENFSEVTITQEDLNRVKIYQLFLSDEFSRE